jgi:hypothetical protein
MKLAPGSRWEGNLAIDKGSAVCYAAAPGELHPGTGILTCSGSVYVTDALAVIDAAGLDPIRAASRKIHELWAPMRYAHKATIAGSDPELADLLNALCHALDEETDDG